MSRITLAIAIIAAAAVWPFDVNAAESYDSCTGYIDSLPAWIGTQGTWCLRKDVSTAIGSGSAITIGTNNVTIDCNGFKLGGLAAGSGTRTQGISADAKVNFSVRNCTIRGFHIGVYALGGGGHLVEDNRLDGNTYIGVVAGFAGNITIRRNDVLDTGGGEGAGAQAIAIHVLDAESCVVTDNTVGGVSPLMEGSQASFPSGILVGCGGAEIRGNRVTGLLAEGSGDAIGIGTFSGSARIVDNYVHGSETLVPGVGIEGQGALTICQRNVVTGMASGIEYCDQADNHVLPAAF